VGSVLTNKYLLTLINCQNSEKGHELGDSVRGDFGRIIGQDPSVFKSNRLHVVIFRFFSSLIWGGFHGFP
jgi:hypothetical protein